jgi:hypothetical protein
MSIVLLVLGFVRSPRQADLLAAIADARSGQRNLSNRLPEGHILEF